MIVVIDYGMGNLFSIKKAFKRVGFEVTISNDIEEIKKATKLILPGVGHFSNGMKNLKKNGLIEILNDLVIIKKIPILGICLGMQLFGRFSEEGNVEGLGWIDSKIVKFNVSDWLKFKIPHIGWNNLKIISNNELLRAISSEDFFYFVHSYHMISNEKSNVLTTTTYDYEFISVVEKDNIYGTQFHPEKSHKKGLQILENFANL